MKLKLKGTPRVVALTTADFNSVMPLFAHNCRYFEYYQNIFNEVNCEQNIIESFSEDIKLVLEYGECFGLYSEDKLKSVLFTFKPDLVMEHKPELMRSLFGNEICISMLKVFAENKGCSYILGVVTDETSRCHGFASRLLSTVTKNLAHNGAVITDAVYINALNLWSSAGYYLLHAIDIRVMKHDKITED